MVQVFDPTDGNMTPCTEPLRYLSYAIKIVGLKWGKVSLACHRDISLFITIICCYSGSACNGRDEASPLSQVGHPLKCILLVNQTTNFSKPRKTNS